MEKKSTNVQGKPVIILVLVLVILFSFAGASGAWFLYRLYESLPTHTQLHYIQQPLVSKVFARDGSLLHEFSTERRYWVSLDEVPLELQQAVLAIEDRKYYDHWGIDIHRIFGAIVGNIVHKRYAQGASTLTQQLARNLYLTSETTMLRKVREALTAIQLEQRFTKEEILELYLNQVYLGAGVYGVQAASEQYFSKDVSEINLNEAATLAGIIQLPERFRPDREANLERVTRRRNTVLSSMVVTGAIDGQTAAQAIEQPIVANPRERPTPLGSYFVEMVRRYVAGRYGDDALFNGGLKIHTTLDPVAQDSTEKAVTARIEVLQARLNRKFLDSTRVYREMGISRDEFLADFDSIYAANSEQLASFPDSLRLRRAQASVVSLDVTTGQILTLVGGRDFQESRFNRAIQARRQPGSAFKPFVFTAAFDEGYNPASVLLDQPITLETPEGEWRPENYDRTFRGPITLREAMASSVNLVAIQLFNSIGAHRVIEYARRMGLKHTMNPVPSLAIGACEVTPMEITSAYSIYANAGVQAEPYFVTKILDNNNRVLEENAANTTEVITPETAYLMSNLMQTVVCCGTGAAIRREGFTRPASGKTGTTNRYSDAWFVGFTPQIVTGVWAGIDERRSMGRGVTGGHAAIPIWVSTMSALHRDLPVTNFQRPQGVKSETICNESHLIATNNCPETSQEVLLSTQELDTCALHTNVRQRRDGSMIDLLGPPRRSREKDRDRSFMF
ncbi:PBP1A family penicillin-binding protein [Chitinispirillales bacterium ANBcel5]|uniref:penicillin-binding protein 1A n=1 Tax=Cellulosispirillum alkaliphilum TaxID=3039283 RepID=UPI002A5947A8|nr:PBP1A family penicillin-binding protein [Chitinispirillales bacterium ANBcel5]